MSAPTIRIIVVSFDRFRRLGLEHALADARYEIVGQGFCSADPILRANPGLVVVDISTVPDSASLIAECRRKLENVLLLIVGAANFNSDAEVLRALTAGVKGYADLVECPDDLLPAVRTVLEGKVWASRSILAKLIDRVSISPLAATTRLSGPHAEVLRLIMNQGLTNKEIALRLDIEERTVEARVTALMRQFRVANRSQLIIYGIKQSSCRSSPLSVSRHQHVT